MDHQMLIIPGKLPGMNEIIDGSKSKVYQHGAKRVYAYTRDKRFYMQKIAQLCLLQKLKPMKRIKAMVIFKERRMSRDPDNIQAGIKFILDGIVHAGILPDDSKKHIASLEYRFEDGSKFDEIVIMLDEVEQRKRNHTENGIR